MCRASHSWCQVAPALPVVSKKSQHVCHLRVARLLLDVLSFPPHLPHQLFVVVFRRHCPEAPAYVLCTPSVKMRALGLSMRRPSARVRGRGVGATAAPALPPLSGRARHLYASSGVPPSRRVPRKNSPHGVGDLPAHRDLCTERLDVGRPPTMKRRDVGPCVSLFGGGFQSSIVKCIVCPTIRWSCVVQGGVWGMP